MAAAFGVKGTMHLKLGSKSLEIQLSIHGPGLGTTMPGPCEHPVSVHEDDCDDFNQHGLYLQERHLHCSGQASSPNYRFLRFPLSSETHHLIFLGFLISHVELTICDVSLTTDNILYHQIPDNTCMNASW